MLTASIVTYHTDIAELENCLQSLRHDAVERIYVVDNGNEAAIKDFCARFGKVEYIPSSNSGYGAAHNIAIRLSEAAGSVYHLVLNPDVSFDPMILPRLLEFMECNHEIGMLQPRIVYPSGEMQYTCRLLPRPVDVFARRFMPRFISRKINRRYLLMSLDHTKPFVAPYMQGSFMLCRMSAIQSVGAFDERFFLYPEDIDLTRRINSRFLTVYYPWATVVHSHRAQSYSSWRMTVVHALNMVRYFNKWGWINDNMRRRVNAQTLAQTQKTAFYRSELGK